MVEELMIDASDLTLDGSNASDCIVKPYALWIVRALAGYTRI